MMNNSWLLLLLIGVLILVIIFLVFELFFEHTRTRNEDALLLFWLLVSFTVSLILLILGYILYIFRERKTEQKLDEVRKPIKPKIYKEHKKIERSYDVVLL